MFILAGCAEYRLTNDFLLERYNESEVPVCVVYPRYVKIVVPNQSVVDMTICYDRNDKIELPILYCQKDMVNIQTTDVTTNVIQQIKVSNKTVLNW